MSRFLTRWPWRSGALLALLLSLWLVSYYRLGGVMLWRHTSRFALALTPGSVNFVILFPSSLEQIADVPFYVTGWCNEFPADSGASIFTTSPEVPEYDGVIAEYDHGAVNQLMTRRLDSVVGTGSSFLGASTFRGTAWDGIIFFWLQIPVWQIAALMVSWLLWNGYRAARNRRFWPGYCAACGYDLRASPERCPECGTPSTASPRMGGLRRTRGGILRFMPERFAASVRRNALWLACVVSMLALALRQVVPQAPHISPIGSLDALIQSQTPGDRDVEPVPFTVIYNLADLYAEAREVRADSGRESEETPEFEDRLRRQKLTDGETLNFLPPFAFATLLPGGHRALIASINELRRGQK